MNWEKPPPVLAITGTDAFLNKRTLHHGMAVARKQSRRVMDVDGEQHEALAGCVSSGFLFTDEQFVVVENPIKADLDLLWRHHESGDTDVVLVLYHDGKLAKNTRLWKKVVSKLPKDCHIQRDLPAHYKMEEYATEFVVHEAKRLGKVISRDNAGLLVRTVGTDLGMLSFEIMKVSLLLDSLGMDAVNKTHMAKTVASMGHADVDALINAVAQMNPGSIMQKMSQIEKGSSSDPTIKVCRRLGAQALRWLQASALNERGLPQTEAAQVMGLNPYHHRNNILPVATRWNKSIFLRLFHGTVEAERGVKRGFVHPWAYLETLLVVTAHIARRGR